MEELLQSTSYYPLKKGDYYIYDDNIANKPLFLKEDEKWNLKIENKSENNVNFFQNDGCLMTQNELKKCDWLCYFKNDFYFIEAKDVKMKKRNGCSL